MIAAPTQTDSVSDIPTNYEVDIHCNRFANSLSSAEQIYIDGVLSNSTATTEATRLPMVGASKIARNVGRRLTGNLQEIRLQVPRSEVWLKAEHDSFCSASFLSSVVESSVLA